MKKAVFHKKRRSSQALSSRWLREQNQKKQRQSTLVMRGLVLILLVLSLSFLFWKIWAQISSSRWDGKHNFNFAVLRDNQTYIITYRFSAKEVNVLLISPETYIPLAKGFGEYPAGSVWQLGEGEKFGGGQLLQLSAQQFLGVPIQGWGRTGKSGQNLKVRLGKRDLLILLGRLIFSAERNLTLWDLGRLLVKINALNKAQINFWSLDWTRAGEEITLPDGSKAYRVQQEFLDTLVRNIYKDTKVLNEGIIWVVINKTNHAGLAAQTARMIDNIGGEVAAFYEKEEPKAEGIYCWEEKVCRSYSVKLLSQSLNLEIKKEQIQENRAEAVAVLSEAYWKFFNQR